MTADRALKIAGIAARTDVELPPPAGRARTEFCLHEGLEALAKASSLYGTALRTAGAHLPKGLRSIPGAYPLHEAHLEHQSRTIGRRRVERWFRNRNFLDDLDDRARILGARFLGPDWSRAEASAREALTGAVAAFYWIDDVALDLEPKTIVSVGSFSANALRVLPVHTTVSELHKRAHALAHKAGELVGGLFGCRLVHDGDGWYKQCPLSFLHIRLGYSPGMICRYSCSLCQQDPSECEHDTGELYPLTAARIEDRCNVCRSRDECIHIPCEVYPARARRSIVEAELLEISVVPRPRNPLARIERLGVDDEKMLQFHGFLPHPESTLLCHDCMFPCTGFSEDENDWPTLGTPSI